MKRNYFAALFSGAMLTTSLLLAGGAAHAQQTSLQNFTFKDIDGGVGGAADLTANIYFTGNPNKIINAYVGRYDAVVGTTSTYVFCTDLNHDISIPQSYSTLAMLGSTTAASQGLLATGTVTPNLYYQAANGTPGGLTSALTSADYLSKNASSTIPVAARADEVAYLTAKYLRSNLTLTDFAGVQLAIWDIVQGGGITTDAGAIQTAANTYETEASFHSTLAPGAVDPTLWIQGPRSAQTGHLQDFVTDPVPEPAFYQMAALCVFGFMGVGRFRKRKGLSK